VKRLVLLIPALLLLAGPLFGYRLLYREQLYRLYRQHLHQSPNLIKENIYWLEQALRADFANPLYALAVIEDERDWERYRYLFTMHLNLTLVELYLQWGNQYNKQVAYFYNYPWRDQNIESLDRAEELFEFALVYWEITLQWSDLAWEFRDIHLPAVQHWADQNHRIETGDLDYEFIINRHLTRLREVRSRFEAMDESTY